MNFRDADYLREWDKQACRMHHRSRTAGRILLAILTDLARTGQRHAPFFAAQCDATLEAFGH
jgi:hypothetical protein